MCSTCRTMKICTKYTTRSVKWNTKQSTVWVSRLGVSTYSTTSVNSTQALSKTRWQSILPWTCKPVSNSAAHSQTIIWSTSSVRSKSNALTMWLRKSNVTKYQERELILLCQKISMNWISPKSPSRRHWTIVKHCMTWVKTWVGSCSTWTTCNSKMCLSIKCNVHPWRG